MKHVIMFIINENTKYLTGKETLSIGHDTTSGTSEVELGSFNEENRKLASNPALHLHELNTLPAQHTWTTWNHESLFMVIRIGWLSSYNC
jgi:hypothetical protein